jgi:hypothetical protein
MFGTGRLSNRNGGLPMTHSRIALISIVSLVTTLVATGVHHIFRLGIGLAVPTLIAFVLAIALWGLYSKTRRLTLLAAYGVFTALVVFWFGFLDGFLDHVVKAAGLENITFLAGGEADIVPTVMQLWSQEASTAFYEGTGILSAILALVTAVSTGVFIYREVPRPATAG